MLRDAALTALFDLRESLLSKRALALLIVYLGGSIATAALFVEVLQEMERAVAEGLAVSITGKPGTMAGELMHSEEFVRLLTWLLGNDEELAQELASMPPMALFYGWASLSMVPALAVFTSSESISRELHSGSCRFAFFRISRASWALGKFGGQAVLLALGVMVGAAGTWAVGWYGLANFDGPGTAMWLVRSSFQAWVYGFAFLGFAMGVSQLTRSVALARALGLIGLAGLVFLGSLTTHGPVVEYAPLLFESLHLLFPKAYKLELWRPELLDRLPAIVMLLGLGGLYFSLGHIKLARGDA
jgi:ABC-type transport system involved in multi-copper enzyme maturation permease subunit